MNVLQRLFGSKARAAIFSLLFQSDSQLYLREIQRKSGLSVSPIQEELKNLSEIGLVSTRRDGNRLYYRANTLHPLFPEIRTIIEKTAGFRGLLGRALADPAIQIAFVFGSVASGTAKPDSDLDLFVIGDLGLRKLTKLLSGISLRIGREVNPHVMIRSEFLRKLQQRDHFVSNVVASEKIFIVGDDDELKRMGKE